MNVKPRVSVLIPTYNYAHYLDETIQSVLDQTYTDFELVVVDNHSTDGTPDLMKKYLVDQRVRYVRNEANIGLVGNWNRCLDLARGEYIKFLCADDKFHPQLLEKFVAVLDQHPGVTIVSSYNQIFGSRDLSRKTPYHGLVKAQCAKESLVSQPVNWLFAPTANMFRRESLTVGRFNTQLHFFVDFEFYFRLLTIGDCYVIPEFLSYIRNHEGMVTVTMNVKRYEHIFERYRFMTIVQSASAATADKTFRSLVREEIRKRAIRCAAVMYEQLPKIYIKKSRKVFSESFRVGFKEGVLFTPILYYFRWKYITKLFAGKN